MSIKIKGADIIAADLETGQVFQFSAIGDATIILPEAKDMENETRRIRSLTHSFETTLEAKIISGFVWRYITGTCSNNELRMHHKPMRRRRPKPKKVFRKIIKVVRTGRGDMARKIRQRRKWSR
jgi:hypothetical protein